MRVAIVLYSVLFASVKCGPVLTEKSELRRLSRFRVNSEGELHVLEKNYEAKINETLERIWKYEPNISNESEWAKIQAGGVDISDCLNNYEYQIRKMNISLARLICRVVAVKSVSYYSSTINGFRSSPDRFYETIHIVKSNDHCIASTFESMNANRLAKKWADWTLVKIKAMCESKVTNLDGFLGGVHENLKSCLDETEYITADVQPIVDQTNKCVEQKIEESRTVTILEKSFLRQ